MKKIRIDDVDWISELPEPILHHIYSFLPFKKVVQTSVLSKQWERTWRTYPVLEFDSSVFNLDLRDRFLDDNGGKKEIQRIRKRLFNGLKQTLRNRCFRDLTRLNKFTIDMQFLRNPEFSSFVERCIGCAIGSNVKELKLKFLTFGYEWYNLPKIVLCAKSIDLLELQGCKLELPSNVKLSCLRKLCLSQVFTDDQVIQALVGSCPLIEEMSLSECHGFKKLELVGLDRLNDIKILYNRGIQLYNKGIQLYNRRLEWVVIKALNVHSLAFVGRLDECDINVAYCKNLKSLSLSSTFIKDEWLYNLISKLPLLECLYIGSCHKLESIKISSPSLRELCINGCVKLAEVDIDTPNLGFFNYFGDMISLSSNALALSKVDLFLFRDKFYTPWNIKYIELLAQFRYCSEILNIQVVTDEDVIVPVELRQILPSPLSSGKHLNLPISKIPVHFSLAKVVDNLLWIAPHVKTMSILKYGHSSKSSFEFSYKKRIVYEGESASCCKSLPVTCWQHCIKEIKVEITDENEEGRNKIKRYYYLEGPDMYEKIDDLCSFGVTKSAGLGGLVV
ncbi:hypothetical protein LWI28_010519 [Acer negundo]|uniref:F-box domain-containing protein n=1 Tax=Acer negundo TaxID=4023 RepID=A0AAD5NJZ2_ACENE|nr:hypothetical protein LWI28_010519 [Acer negundo]